MSHDTFVRTETGIRRLAHKQRAAFPRRGDFFVLEQVEFLLRIIDKERAELNVRRVRIDELTAERDARMALFNTAAEIAGAAIADLQRDLDGARALIGQLNAKLDVTHTNRCERCANTVAP